MSDEIEPGLVVLDTGEYFMAHDLYSTKGQIMVLNGHEGCEIPSHQPGSHATIILVFVDAYGGQQIISVPVDSPLGKVLESSDFYSSLVSL